MSTKLPELLTIIVTTRFVYLIARFQPIIGTLIADCRLAIIVLYTDQNFEVDYDFKFA